MPPDQDQIARLREQNRLLQEQLQALRQSNRVLRDILDLDRVGYSVPGVASGETGTEARVFPPLRS